jgi:hypothetical protein
VLVTIALCPDPTHGQELAEAYVLGMPTTPVAPALDTPRLARRVAERREGQREEQKKGSE